MQNYRSWVAGPGGAVGGAVGNAVDVRSDQCGEGPQFESTLDGAFIFCFLLFYFKKI